MPLLALRAYASENPQSFAGQMALGRALRKEKQLDEAAQAFERAAALVPVARGPASPHAQLAGDRDGEERSDPRHRGAAGAHGRRLRQHRGGPPARLAASRDAASPIRRQLRPVYERIAAIDPYDRRRARDARPAGDAARRAGDRGARVPRGDRARSGGPRRRHHRSGGELFEGREDKPKRRRKRSPRSRSRRATSARRRCCSSSSQLAT